MIGWRLDDVVQKIRGPGGTLVRLQLLPAGAAPGSAQKVVEFTRNRVSLEAQASHKAMRMVQRNGRDVKVGVITVPSFYQDYDASRAGAKDFRSTTRDVQRLIGELRKDGAEVLIMDLRANGGGYLPEAESLTGLFIDQGPVVQLRDTTGRIEVDEDPEPAIYYSGPLIVLVDRFSASASEIFAGAIQDYGRGLIIGQTDLRQGHRAERAPAELHDFRAQAGSRPAQRDHRQVLPHHRREHAGPRRRRPTSPCPR